MKVKYVFFDCWDTIIHYQTKEPHSELKRIYDHIIEKDKYSFDQFVADKETFMKRYYSITIYDVRVDAIIRYLIESRGLHLDCSFEKACDDMVEGYEDKTIDGVEKFTAFLDTKGVHYSVLSNTVLTYEQTKRIINESWPNNKFDIILASSTYAVKKPDSLFFKLGALKVNQKPEDCIFIGDNINTDIAGAYESGMHPFYFNWKMHKPTELSLAKAKEFVEFHSYEELEEILSNKENYEF